MTRKRKNNSFTIPPQGVGSNRLNVSERYMKDVRDNGGMLPILTADEEKALSAKISKGCKESLDEMVTRNLRLVVNTVRKYDKCGVDVMDLINEGNLGLIEAAKKYKSSKKTRFSTYAGFWIRQKMMRYINNHSRTVRIPCHAYSSFAELKKITEEFTSKYGSKPTVKFLSRKVGLSESQVKNLLPYVDSPIYLDSKISETEQEKQEVLCQSTSQTPSDKLLEKEEIDIISKALKKLNKRERFIIEHRFGFNSSDILTLEKIGEKFKVTRERIRQVEKQALEKVKNYIRQYKIEKLEKSW